MSSLPPCDRWAITCSGLMISTSCGVWMSPAVTGAFAFLAQDQRDFVAVVQAEHHALQVQHDVDDVFLHAVDRRVLVQHAGDRHFGRRVADHRRQQHAAQRVAERVAVAALERLERDLGAVAAERLDVDGFGFQQIGLHEVLFLSIPSARYTDKADGLRRAVRRRAPVRTRTRAQRPHRRTPGGGKPAPRRC